MITEMVCGLGTIHVHFVPHSTGVPRNFVLDGGGGGEKNLVGEKKKGELGGGAPLVGGSGAG